MKKQCAAWAAFILLMGSAAHAADTETQPRKGGGSSLAAAINRIADDVDETTEEVRKLRTEISETKDEVRELKNRQQVTLKQLEEQVAIQKVQQLKQALIVQRQEKIESALACAHDELAKSKQLAHENAMVAQQNAAAAESLLGLVEQANKRAGYNRGPRGRLGPLGAMGAALGKVMPRFFGHTP